MEQGTLKASFRDPSGFIFTRNGTLYRQINRSYASNYRLLVESGLYAELVKRGYLVPHEETEERGETGDSFKVIRPERIPFISYPYEWSFSQLQDAAKLTLKIERIALKFGMTLKDASAYNIQFRNGAPVLIDTLSFEKYEEGLPWVAYRQFCRHFLAPLALMAMSDVRLGQLPTLYVDGIPLDLASRLLPRRSWFKPALFFHIHMHAKSEVRYAETKVNLGARSFTLDAFRGLLDNLKSGVESLEWKPAGTTWADYYDHTNYSASAKDEKLELVRNIITHAKPKSVWDLGANEGLFSRLASERGIFTVAFDIDHASVERNYREVRDKKETNLLPLFSDFANPSPAIGWNNAERMTLKERGPVDLALALALIHHLTITNNVPFGLSAAFFADICRELVIEFVPKEDSQVKRLLKNREDIFKDYTPEAFEAAYQEKFTIRSKQNIPGTARTLYHLERK